MKNTQQQSAFKREIELAEKQLLKAQKSMELMKQKSEAGYLENAYYEAFNFEDICEKLTLAARLLPAYTGSPQAPKLSEQVTADNIPVRIGFTPEGWFGVVIPALLPKKYKGSPEYIRKYLYPAMKNFFRGKQPVRYNDCVMIFRHIYRRDRPERRYRDHDNIELNAVVDAVSFYVLYDDAPLMCEHYYCSASGDEDRTEVFVVPRKEFGAWIADSKTYKNKEVILHENLP
jgi:hypothetical protein